MIQIRLKKVSSRKKLIYYIVVVHRHNSITKGFIELIERPITESHCSSNQNKNYKSNAFPTCHILFCLILPYEIEQNLYSCICFVDFIPLILI